MGPGSVCNLLEEGESGCHTRRILDPHKPKGPKEVAFVPKELSYILATADLMPGTFREVEPHLTPEYLALSQRTLTQIVRTQETQPDQSQRVPKQTGRTL